MTECDSYLELSDENVTNYSSESHLLCPEFDIIILS